jgi:hypothetical protein
MNKKQAIIKSFREHYMQKDGEWGYHGWVEETSFDDVELFLSQKLDEYGEEAFKEGFNDCKRMVENGEHIGCCIKIPDLKGQNDKD